MSFHSIIERGRSMAETYHQIMAEQCVGPMARFAAERILSAPGSEIRVGIGETPKGITDEEFMRRVGAAAEISLHNVACPDIVVYDHEASEQLIREIAASPYSGQQPQAEGAWVVFQRVMDPS